MKKQLLLLVMMLLPMVARADYSGTCGENLTWTFVESTGTLTISGSGAMDDNFNYNSAPLNNILVVVIEDGVTSIGDNAFCGCSSLTSVTIPNSVTSIGSKAFLLCSSLTSVTIPNSVTSIGEHAFHLCI